MGHTRTIYVSNDMTLTLASTSNIETDTFTSGNAGAEISDIVDSNDNTVGGLSFPVSLDFQSNTSGFYEGTIDASASFSPGTDYWIDIKFSDSKGAQAQWRLKTRAERRTP